MKILSQLSNDTMLCVISDADTTMVMDKADFVTDHLKLHLQNPYSVFIAEKEVATFDLHGVIEVIGEDDMYDGWVETVWDDIKDAAETHAFLDMVKSIFRANPTYYAGESVFVDIAPK